MKKKVLLLAIIAMMTTVFDSVPVYAQEAGTKDKKETSTQTGESSMTVPVSAGAVVIEGEEPKSVSASKDTEQNTETEATEKEAEAKADEKKEESTKKESKETEEKVEKTEAKTEKTEEKTETKSEKAEAKTEKTEAKSEKTDAKKEEATKDKDSKEKKTEKTETKADEKTEAKKEEKKKDTKKEKTYSNADVKLLACLIYAEAGNQSYKGKLAVGNVVMNRVKSALFPNTLKSVIYQSSYSRSYGRTIYQFSVASPSIGTLKKALNVYGKRTNSIEIQMENECIKAAKAALEGKSAIDEKNYLFFCVYNSSLASRKSGVKIGAHYFYK